jgi:hypothetical protein
MCDPKGIAVHRHHREDVGMRRIFASSFVASSALGCLVSACSESTSSPVGPADALALDVGPPSSDASVDVPSSKPDASGPDSSTSDAAFKPDGSGPDSSTSDAALLDATTDAPPYLDAAEASAPPTLLTVVGVDTVNTPRAGAYKGGAWTVGAVGSDIFSPGGGGVAVLSASQALASLRGNANSSLETATYDGTWSNLSLPGPATLSYVGPPVATATGAALVFMAGTGSSPLYAARYASATKTWTTTNESVVAQSDNQTVPWLVETSSKELALYATGAGSYASVAGSGGTWGTQAVIPGATVPRSVVGAVPSIVGVRRAGTDQVVAAWITGSGPSSFSIITGVWSAGAWTVASTALATDVASSQARPFAMTALPDGRVALAYLSAASVVKFALYDGTSWGAVATVPGTVTSVRVPVAIAAGVGGSAIVELAYIDANRHPQHTRLTSEAPLTWSGNQAIDGAETYDAIDLASGP